MPTRRRTLQALAATGTAGLLGSTVYGQLSASKDAPTALVAGSLLTVASNTEGASIEAHGSATVAQLVRDDLRDPDAVALADPALFRGITDEFTLFATNALVLTYDPQSARAGQIRQHWREAVRDPDVAVGRTDPKLDPLGYRTVMALRLADGIDAENVLDESRIFAETGLLNALEAGGIDAAFTYRNMAVERDLPYVDLPASIDFSDPTHAETYATVSYDLPEQTVQGAPIRYGVTALTPAGEPWVETLVAEDRRLEMAGFTIPRSYPKLGRP
ncbi:extracellular solute-binding protein [Haloarchaeobius amylolyticus]|uniref:extracellular solute-binding protein n=1 Tax=Haloarchaeobius amylolyticus TaxID=1198296 RepID=UPI00226F39BD|nr:extracellular solute-binding protein [Haloarchaeobius amylolyticus]